MHANWLVGRSFLTGNANQWRTTGEDAERADVPPRQSILDGRGKQTSAESDDGALAGLIDGVVRDVGRLRRRRQRRSRGLVGSHDGWVVGRLAGG